MVTIDMANAFNTIDRGAFREAVRAVCPSAAPWVDACYAEPSRLVFGDFTLTSARGAQQGDPWGPGLYALAIHEDIMGAVDSHTRGSAPGGNGSRAEVDFF